MIIKNTNIWNLENVDLIALGKGDVAIGTFGAKDHSWAGITFKTIDEGEIGREINYIGKNIGDIQPEIMILCNSLESLQILKHAILKAEEILLTNNGGLTKA